jgi:hypothetical protein
MPLSSIRTAAPIRPADVPAPVAPVAPVATGRTAADRPQATSASDASVFYTIEKYGTLQEFLKHADFKIFEEQYQAGIRELIKFVSDHASDSGAEKNLEVLNLAEDFNYFLRAMPAASRYDSETRADALRRKQEIYGDVKKTLDRIRFDIANSAAPSKLIDAVKPAYDLLRRLHTDSRISYDPTQFTLREFLKHPDFPIFERQFTSGLNGLVDFVRNEQGNCHTNGRALGAIEKGAQRFITNLFSNGVEYRCKKRDVAYHDGKNALDRLLGFIADGSLPKADFVDTVKNLAPDLMVCPDGATTNLSDAVNRLQRLLGGGNWASFVQSKADEYINAFVSRFAGKYKISCGNQVHYVNALRNALADFFGFEKRNDGWANVTTITDAMIVDCTAYLNANMTQASLVLAYAEEYLCKITDLMNPHFRDGNSAQAFDATYIEKLEDAMAKLAPSYGVFDLCDIRKPISDSHFQIYTDASLAAKAMLGSKFGSEKVAGLPFERAEKLQVKPTALGIHTWGENIFWADVDGDAEILEISHLRQLPPDACGEGLVAYMDRIVKNSDADALLAQFTPAWLPHVDPAMLLGRLGGAAFLAFFEKHAADINKLPREKLAAFVEQIVKNIDPDVLLKDRAQAWLPHVAPAMLSDRLGMAAFSAFTAKHWANIKKLPYENLVAFMNQIIMNAGPDELLEKFASTWLPHVDPVILAEKLDKVDFPAFVDKHGAAIKKLPPKKLTQYWGMIIKQVSPACLKNFCKDLTSTLLDIDDGQTTLWKFHDIAVKHGKLDIVRTFQEIPHFKSQRRISESKLPLFTRGESVTNDVFAKERKYAGKEEAYKEILARMKTVPKGVPSTMKEAHRKILAERADARKIFLAGAKDARKKILAMKPAFKREMREGTANSIAAFGNTVLLAFEKNILSKKDIVALLTGPSHQSALKNALSANNSGAVAAFGGIVLSAYHANILGGDEVCNILDCPPRDRGFSDHIAQTQGEALMHADDATQAAFGDILQSFDTLLAGKPEPARSIFSYFKPPLSARLDDTKRLWLACANPYPFVKAMMAPKNALSIFLHDYRGIMRRLPRLKRIAFTKAVVLHGSAADLNAFVKNDDRLFSPHFYKNVEWPRFLSRAANREDIDMIKAVGDLLIKKLLLSGKLSRHVKDAMDAELSYISLLGFQNAQAGELARQYVRKMRELQAERI